MHFELRVVLTSQATATLKGSGAWDKVRFTVEGDQSAVDYLGRVLASKHSGYEPVGGPWGGKIGKSLPKLLNVLYQLSHDTPGCPAEIGWQWVREPDWDALPKPPKMPPGTIY